MQINYILNRIQKHNGFTGISIRLSQPLYVVVQRFWASDMFDHFLVGKGLAEHGILEKSEKEQTTMS